MSRDRRVLAVVCLALWLGTAGASLVRAEPLPGQIVVHPETNRWFAYNRDANGDGRLDPFFLCGAGDPEGFLYRGSLQSDGTRDGDQLELIERMGQSGANSIYMQIVRSHGGDGPSDHNPWVDSDPSLGLNPAILDQWEGWFTAMDEAGIAIYLLFYDDSTRVWSADAGPQELAFVRDIVNRFEHHTHMIWGLAEEYEEAYSAEHMSALAAEIRAADDHDHPIAIHTLARTDLPELADDPHVDQHMLQLESGGQQWVHGRVRSAWSHANGRYGVNMSEAIEHGTGMTMRLKNWAAALGGGYVMVLGMDIANTTDADLAACGRQRLFFESTDFTRMAPHNELATGYTDHVLALPGETYIVYAHGLGGQLGVRDLAAGTYALSWFDPVSGAQVEQTHELPGGESRWSAPSQFGSEAVIWLRRIDGSGNVVPTAQPASVIVASPVVTIELGFSDPDGPGPHSFSIVEPPAHGALTGEGPLVDYHADPGYAGSDSFSFVVDDGLDVSPPAVIQLDVASSGNDAPAAHSQTVTVPAGTPTPFTLTFHDADGPGPYTFEIVEPPAHGNVTGSGAQRSYAPNVGFQGWDELRWRVHDGVAASAEASVLLWVFPPTSGTSGLLADWRLDEGAGVTVGDASGNGITGTVHGADWIQGFFGGALEFDGIDDTVVFDEPLSLGPEGTLAFWMRPAPQGHRERILGGADAWELTIEEDGRLYTHLAAEGGDIVGGEQVLQVGQWVHVACTWDRGTGELRLYLDGELEGLSATAADDDPGTVWLTLGHRTGVTHLDEHFRGALDALRLYDRVLSEPEIDQLADGGTPGATLRLRFDSKTSVTWDPPANPGGSDLVYDVLRSGVAADFLGSTVCVETNDGSDTSATDEATPAAGQVFFYLSRAQSFTPSWTGSLGTTSQGVERVGRTCP